MSLFVRCWEQGVWKPLDDPHPTERGMERMSARTLFHIQTWQDTPCMDVWKDQIPEKGPHPLGPPDGQWRKRCRNGCLSAIPHFGQFYEAMCKLEMEGSVQLAMVCEAKDHRALLTGPNSRSGAKQ